MSGDGNRSSDVRIHNLSIGRHHRESNRALLNFV